MSNLDSESFIVDVDVYIKVHIDCTYLFHHMNKTNANITAAILIAAVKNSSLYIKHLLSVVL